MDIVFRVGGDGYEGVLFARREDAERVAQIREALRRSKTWGEFRANLPPGEWESNLQERFLIGEEPPDDEAFTAGDVPGYADGDYPEWLMQTQLDWFPAELIRKYGDVETSVLNGEMLELPAGDADAIAADLRSMGYRVEPTELDIS